MNQVTSGEKLFQWIINRYRHIRTSGSWVTEMSREFAMDDLEDYLMRSTALMVLRRLLWNAAWYVKTYTGEKLTIIEIFEKDYLQGRFGFDPSERRMLSKLVFDAYDASEATVPSKLENKLFTRAVQANERCRICGDEIDYTDRTNDKSFSLDHIWPRKMGGESAEWNLRIAHRICNSRRNDLVEASDSHYEHFHVKSSWSPDNSANYWKQLTWEFRIASLLRAGFQCEVCKAPIPIHELEGELGYSIKDRRENLNIFNVQITCNRHERLSGNAR